MKEVNEVIEELLFYGRKHLDLNDLDEVFLRNLLLHRLNCSEPYMGKIDEDKISSLTVADSLIEDLNEAIKTRDGEVSPLLNVEILGLLTPMPSFVADKVNRLEKEEHGKGLDYLFNLEIANNYIQKIQEDRKMRLVDAVFMRIKELMKERGLTMYRLAIYRFVRQKLQL